MNDAALALLPVWGLVLIAVFNAVGRCGIPFPSSAVMITYGALVVDSMPALLVAIAIAYGAALAGDVLAYPIGQRLGGWLEARSTKSAKTAALLRQADALSARWGSLAVLITRWPLSTIGPYVNLSAGVLGLRFRAYLIWCAIGELIWTALYLGAGYAFASNLDRVMQIAQQSSVAALALAGLAGAVLMWRFLRRRGQKG